MHVVFRYATIAIYMTNCAATLGRFTPEAQALPVSKHISLNADSMKTGEVQQGTQDSAELAKKDDNPFAAVIFGLILWWLVPVCLWNNERIALKQYKMQYKAEKWALHIDDPTREPLKEMDGRIVYVQGESECTESLSDSEFTAVKSSGKLKLRRVVETYQWVEHEHTEKNGDDEKTTYTYTQEWRDTPQSCPHDSSKSNFPMPFTSTRRQDPAYRASVALSCGNGDKCAEASHENVKLGAYYLGDFVIRELQNWQSKEDVKSNMLKTSKKDVGALGDCQGGWWYFSGKNGQAPDAACPQLGNVRVRFEELCPGPLTIVGVLAQTKVGWTFVPIMRADAAGTGDNCAVEIGQSCLPCCFRVKELHFGDPEDDQKFQELLERRPVELKKEEKGALRRSATAAVVSYDTEKSDDLCCSGPFGGLMIKFMHWVGLEEEFLSVMEERTSLASAMKAESAQAASRHHTMRVVGCLLLVLASYLIISPIIKLLNYNWITTLLGGGIISFGLCLISCLCSISTFLGIASTAWIFYRPWLATFGLLSAAGLIFGMRAYVHSLESHPAAAAALLTLRNSSVFLARH